MTRIFAVSPIFRKLYLSFLFANKIYLLICSLQKWAGTRPRKLQSRSLPSASGSKSRQMTSFSVPSKEWDSRRALPKWRELVPPKSTRPSSRKSRATWSQLENRKLGITSRKPLPNRIRAIKMKASGPVKRSTRPKGLTLPPARRSCPSSRNRCSTESKTNTPATPSRKWARNNCKKRLITIF